MLCIGGGVSKQGSVLIDPIQAYVDEEDYARNNISRTRIVCAELFNDAGIVGAAMLGKQEA